MILGLDVSHHQGAVNFAAARSAGRDFVVLKATEGVGYTDPNFATYRAQAHAAGLIVGIYHFARDNSPASEAAYFAGAVGALQPGEFLVLDQEVAHASGNVPWCTAWLAAVAARYGVAPLIYMNQGSATGVTSGNWTQVAQTYGLWLAKYDNAPGTQTTVNYWGPVAMKQYSDAGSVLGVAGTCDVNAFYGTTTQLLAYGKQATSTGDDMTPDQWNFIQQGINVTNAALGNLLNAVGDPKVGLAKLTGDVHGKVVDSVFGLDGRPGPDKDDLLGQVLSLRAELRAVAAEAGQTVNVDATAVADALAASETAIDKLADAIAAKIATRLGNG